MPLAKAQAVFQAYGGTLVGDSPAPLPQPAVTLPQPAVTLPQPRKPNMGLLAALLPSVLQLFAPRAQAALQKVTGQGPDVTGPFLQSLFGQVSAVTGEADPVAATAALQKAPQEQVKAVEDHALDYLDKIAPMFDKIADLDKLRMAADDADMASARAFTPRVEVAPRLIKSSDWAFGAALVGMLILVGMQMYFDPDHKPDTTLVVILTGLVLAASRVFERPFLWRFGSMHDSVAQDVGRTTIDRATTKENS